jgi:hypothetical protein
MDPATLATAATAVLTPYLIEASKGAAKKLGEETGGKLFAWLSKTLTGGAKEALDDLESTPDDTDNQAVLRKQLAKLLAADPFLAKELQSRLPDAGTAGGTMTVNAGAGAKVAQVKGNNNTTSIS